MYIGVILWTSVYGNKRTCADIRTHSRKIVKYFLTATDGRLKCIWRLSPSREAPFRAWARCEGTNSFRSFSPGERKALSVAIIRGCHDVMDGFRQWSQKMALCPEWDKQDLNFHEQMFQKSFHTGSFEAIFFAEMRRNVLLYGKSWYRASLLCMFINVYEFCCFNVSPKLALLFLLNEAVSFLNYPV